MQQTGSQTPQQPASPVKRPARSKNGCMTCRRRKVRCNEIRPICGHCSRLNLECRWRPSNSTLLTNSPGGTLLANRVRSDGNTNSGGSSRTLEIPPQPSSSSAQESFDDVFNYASFMWDGPEIWKPPSWGNQDVPVVDQALPNAIMTPSFSTTLSPPMGNTFDVSISSNSDGYPVLEENAVSSSIPSGDRALLDYFVQSVVPPIIAQVETQSKWASMRQTLISMSRSSSILRHAILTFSSLLLSRQGEGLADTTQKHYAQTVAELTRHDEVGHTSQQRDDALNRAAMLATLFFLSYTDLLEGRNELLHSNLKRAFGIYQSSDKTHFRAVEIRLLSWIRMIDARAVSAGGEGLFLSEIDEKLLSYASPGSLDGGDLGIGDQPETDIEEVLFDILYQPGIVFFQKVQSFSGRIAHLDPFHRRRGTVEDETEVMSIAAEISKDLRQLYDARPPLMDYASAGLLVAPHVSSNLALTISRAFRTFLSNYHASKIHLHRVAYKSLPLAKETIESIDTIRNLAKLLVDRDAQDMLPVNMLWPLLMWGSEEKDGDERAWIKSQILRMEKVATNARITSQVLEEVQKRQDTLNARQDIREVMEHVFNSCWAIV
ncbi:fungal-specific transcription factor domain-containing protein [Annulohypoxylon maeteangense]|uniref:fungal-specific transcription factor domain-containing protein n=1 Tax=Annulohypoxylon maeteangense TaxID=1927788 RepID=UPI002007530B|nr:fungal-specific transcription factor domain-containing protein [Annulohypoxylon maeteangense]KAI0888934.1 fungal-specific transcription factor domain-containing protein [Annulohypoxylon maeteangense]